MYHRHLKAQNIYISRHGKTQYPAVRGHGLVYVCACVYAWERGGGGGGYK